MKSWQGYGNRFMTEIFALKLSALETVMIAALVLMCLMSAFESTLGRNIGNANQVRMAKQHAQQELMALRTSSVNR